MRLLHELRRLLLTPFFPDCLPSEPRQHLRNGLPRYRISQLRIQFRQRRERKSALAITRVRDLQLVRGYDEIAVEQNIDIDRPRPVADPRSPAAQIFFDFLNSM